MAETKLFAHSGEGKWTDLGGSRRRILLDTEELMLVEVAFEAGAVGPLHSHPHVQASYVAEGLFEVTIDGVTETLSAGASFVVPSNLVHGVRALRAGRLIDSFTPRRADFADQGRSA
jgi:quercetin dioxygenase-like cupin family protein